MTLISELIDVPERVHKGDFVLRLTEGLERSKQTLDDYVVTPQLASAFDQALGIVAGAIQQGTAKAAYLHGSFGSGKSHFMAVLHLLLQGDPDARAIPELAEAISRHDPVLQGRRFLLVPYHMLGHDTMEQALLGGYVSHVREHHPESPTPPVFASEHLLRLADTLRRTMGDDAFFAKLSEGDAGGGGGWGMLATGWDAARYERARAAAHDDPDRKLLESAVIDRLLERERAATDEFVSLDEGLSIISQHAKDLGYHGLVLFLDELILWLASRIVSQEWVSREAAKVVKLVEAQHDRALPIISFVARQRDLREFVGDHLPGAEHLSFADALGHMEGRFETVRLDDRNLAAIAERRLLRPRSEAARQQIDEAFRKTERERQEVLDVLMTAEGDRERFRATYPFSPACVNALVAISSALQRERTALKVMLQLLVDQRDELRLGDIVGVGDLFDVIAEGDEPFSEDMKRPFELARRLYRDKLRPQLLAMHGLTEEQAADLPRDHELRADDRLVKTLLLAAMVPEEPTLRTLDVGRLVALNHGSIRSPIPGQEKAIALRKLQRLRSVVPEVKLGDDTTNPTVSIRLVGVDTDAIVDRARSVDNQGERRKLITEMLLAELGIERDGRLMSEHRFQWRGTTRTAEILVANVRDPNDLPDDMLRPSDAGWRLVIDYPFDDGHTPADDLARLEAWREQHPAAQTVCWVPAHLSRELIKDLGNLVVLEHILSGERFDGFASHLAPVDRATARQILTEQRSALREKMRIAIRQAYGVERAEEAFVDLGTEPAEHLPSLLPGFSPQMSVGESLGDALNGLLGQMFEHQFPKHPHFDIDVRPRDLRVVLEEMGRAAAADGGRIDVPRDRRQVMRGIAAPLRLGQMFESHFIAGDHWRDHFDRKIAAVRQSGESEVTLGDLRAWIDQPEPLGLPRDVQDLVICTYAIATGRTFRLHGAPVPLALESVRDDAVLHEEELPEPEVWERAVRRAASVLGLTPNPLRSAGSMAELASQARDRAQAVRSDAVRALRALETRLNRFGIERESSARYATAKAAVDLLMALDGAQDAAVVHALAGAELPESEQAVGTAVGSARQLADTLESDRWALLEGSCALADQGQQAHAAIVARMRDALTHHELAEQLEPAVAHNYERAVKLIKEGTPPTKIEKVGGHRSNLSLAEARGVLDEIGSQHDGAVRITIEWTVDRET